MALTPEKIQQMNEITGLQMPTNTDPAVKARIKHLKEIATKPKDDLLNNPVTRGIQSVFPGKKIGESLGTIAAASGRALEGDMKGAGDILDTQVPIPELIGDYAGAATQIGSAVLPAAKTIAGSAAQLGGLGAAAAGSKSVSEGNDWKQAAKDAFIGGATGAAVGGALGAGTKTITKLVTRGPEALYNNALNVSKRVKAAGQSPSADLIEKGIWGDLGSIQKASEEGIEQANKEIARKLANVVEPIDGSAVLTDARNRLIKQYEGVYSTDQIDEMIRNVPAAALLDSKAGKTNFIPANELNELRSKLDNKLLGERFYLSNQPASTKDAIAAVADAMRSAVQKTSDTANEFKNLSGWIKSIDAVDEALDAADKGFRIGFRDILASGIGASLGGPVGAIGGLALERASKSATALTGTAVLLDRLKNLPVDSVGNVSQAAITRLLSEFGSNPDQEPSQ